MDGEDRALAGKELPESLAGLSLTRTESVTLERFLRGGESILKIFYLIKIVANVRTRNGKIDGTFTTELLGTQSVHKICTW